MSAANYSTIKVVCDDASHPGKTVNVAEFGGWGTNWSVDVVGRRKSLIDNAPLEPHSSDGYVLWPTLPNGPLPPTFLHPRLRCRLCRQALPERALDPTIMHPVLNHLAAEGVSRLTLRELAVVASKT